MVINRQIIAVRGLIAALIIIFFAQALAAQTSRRPLQGDRQFKVTEQTPQEVIVRDIPRPPEYLEKKAPANPATNPLRPIGQVNQIETTPVPTAQTIRKVSLDDAIQYQSESAVVTPEWIHRTEPPISQNYHQHFNWLMRLDEAIQVALVNNRDIKVIGLETDVGKTEIRQAYDRFDPRIEANHHWAGSNSRLSNILDTFGTGATFQGAHRYGSETGKPDQIAVSRIFFTGAKVRLGLSAGYNRLSPAGSFNTLNPTWRTSTTLHVSQPLAKGRGRRVNVLPIRIAQSYQQVTEYDFESRVNKLVRDVEYGYWNLLFAHQNLEVRRKELVKARKTFEKVLKQMKLGESSRPEVGEARLAYYYAIDKYNERKFELLEDERIFRQLLGIQGFDDRRIFVEFPADFPEIDVQWERSFHVMLASRPEVLSQQQSVKTTRLEYELARNQCLPDFNFEANLNKNGLSDSFDEAFSRMVKDPDYGWMVGFTFDGRWCNVRASAETRRKHLKWTQQCYRLDQMIHDSTHRLQKSYVLLYRKVDQIAHMKKLREAATERLRALEEKFELGELSIDRFLKARADNADMELREHQAKVELLQSITDFEYVRGTLLEARNVELFDRRPELQPNANREKELLQPPRVDTSNTSANAPEFKDLIKSLPPELQQRMLKQTPVDPLKSPVLKNTSGK